jgi:diguanylate cyclase (GGDEF)-like protein
VGMFADITEWKKAQDVIIRQANFDTLTGLPNRRLFRDRLEYEMKRMDRDQGKMALMFVDLDHFKEVNDTLGHDAGDQLLVDAAKRMVGCVRVSDTVARLGGDEFAIILASVPNAQMSERIAESLNASIQLPFVINGENAHVSASIGVTVYPDDAIDAEALMKNADQAMYAAKNLGRARFCWFTGSMQQAADERVQLSRDLRDSMSNGTLKVYFQPIVDLKSGKIVKAEALIRWHHPTLGTIPPLRFIPIAEETGMISILGTWVFRQSAVIAKKWVDWAMASGDEELAKSIRISVNKSPKQFHVSTCYEDWMGILQEIGLHPSHMVIEITENLFLGDHVDMAAKLQRFRDVGMALSLDDFGTGYSSLGYLKKYEVDYLKMDQSFVRGMMERPNDRAIAEAILAMAQKLRLDVVAEGVETQDQCDFLIHEGCRYGQGFFFWHPMPDKEFMALVAPCKTYSAGEMV